jgi:hypothetical protein
MAQNESELAGLLTNCRARMGKRVRARKEANESGVLTNYRMQNEGEIRPRQEHERERGPHQLSNGGGELMTEGSERARSTHQLSSTKGGLRRDRGRKRASGGYSQPVERREGEESRYGKQQKSEGHSRPVERKGSQLRGRYDSEQPKGTHYLWNGEGGSSKGTEGTQAREAHSRAVQCRGRTGKCTERIRAGTGTHSLSNINESVRRDTEQTRE